MVIPVRHTNTKKKRMGHKKHDMQYFCCLRRNDGDGKVEFQGLSDSCEVVQSTKTKRKDNGPNSLQEERLSSMSKCVDILTTHGSDASCSNFCNGCTMQKLCSSRGLPALLANDGSQQVRYSGSSWLRPSMG
ncbi:hypothetical protein AVEN_64108-1 [Araneus ventricosus]|uniref:Uncharacterized protein n=1 Tax=Araneus ventricosus TaxID=182803 RepID=A0A4Y2C3T1_ARAVE|nr:hypothetical protein AVEN_64108-1 [Araneus ventricosus]